MNFNNYKFRASSLPNLLIDGRSKDGSLSETTKSFLREIFIQETYGREHFVVTKYMRKGTMCESDSLDLVEEALGQTYFKNKEKLENEFITGTPDVIEKPKIIIDIKTSWDIWTFAAVDEEKARKDYYGQLLGYMWLTNVKESRLHYCLVNTPEALIEQELYKLTMSGVISESPEDQDKARISYLFDDIPVKDRVKTYDFKFDDEIHQKLIEKIKLSREYLNTLTL